MDIAVGARRCLVMTEHTTRDGAPKLVATCSYPLTAVGVVTTVYTDLAVVDLDGDGFVVREIASGVTVEELQAKTGAPLRVAPDCATCKVPAL
jgi:3-oxoacid CoA-transferase B subunit